MIQVVSVYNKTGFTDIKGESILSDINDFLKVRGISEIKAVKKYYLEGITKDNAKEIAEKLLSENLWQDYKLNESFFNDTKFIREVAYKPGIMNPETMSILDVIKDMGFEDIKAVDSSYEYYFYGDQINLEKINLIVSKLLMNSLIEEIRESIPKTLIIEGKTPEIENIPIRNLNDSALMKISTEGCLYLDLDEMKIIQNYFKKIGREPTDAELETLAQTWSEHCVHKTFKANLVIDGVQKKPLFTRIKEVSKEVSDKKVISAFIDNSGVVEFYDGYAVNGKVETHNAPSALDPYGGAMTGSGGVFRDILGTGQGAKVIASTDIFCVGNPDILESNVPEGCKHPRYLLKKVVQGVKDYGNRMGIPTNNGSVHFHKDFRAKPSIIVGSFGILPIKRAKKGKPRLKDLVVIVGGRTGRDGIHGATFSSAEMSDRTFEINAAAVQIGNAIEEKRVHDAILEIRDKGIIRAITDCGAGGFSSAIGELGSETGVKIELSRAPLKYTGLAPWEIWLSESQERMVICIPPSEIDDALKVFKKYGVEASIVGEFTESHKLEVLYNSKKLIDIDMQFLHEGLPNCTLEGVFAYEEHIDPAIPRKEDFNSTLKKVLSHYNVCSKEVIVRQYDHNIQGSAVQMPFCGKSHNACNDGAVIEPILGSKKGLAIAHGLNPILNRIDPYFGSEWAILEAISNLTALGASLKDIYLIDNFIWPTPDEKYLGYLDRSVDACVDTVRVLGTPFVSGKDSLSSTYRDRLSNIIQIPPVLCISAFARIDNIFKTVSAPLKKKGDKVFMVGETFPEMGGSVYYDIYKGIGNDVPRVNIEYAKKVFEKIFQCINNGMINSCHDISEGGLASALSEMCFTNGFGVAGDLDNIAARENLSVPEMLFSETPARFLVSISEKDIEKFKEILNDIPYAELGDVNDNGRFVLRYRGEDVINSYVSDLKKAWETPLNKIL